MKVIFCGTPAFVVPVLVSVADSRHEVVGVVSRPDRPAGRGHRLSSPPVKREAARRGIPVLQPADVNSADALEALGALGADAILVAAFGQKLSGRMLALTPPGCLNVHLSLLPRYRGAAPVARAIQHGETGTGVTIMRPVERVDAGPVLLQRKRRIESDATAGDLRAALGRMGADAAVEALDLLESGRAVFVPQDDSMATYAPPLGKDEGRVDWSRPAEEIRNLVRAMNPWPMAFTFQRRPRNRTVRLILIDVGRTEDGGGAACPGEVLRIDKAGPVVATGGGCLLLRRVKPAGGGEMDGAAYARGYRIEAGERFMDGADG